MRDHAGRRIVATIAAAAALPLLAGACSGSENAGPPPGPTDTPVDLASPSLPTPPDRLVSWADDVCRAVARHTQDVTPPSINPQDPAATIGAFKDLFATMHQLMTRQRAELGPIGAPPEAAMAADYDDSLRRFDEARQLLVEAEQKLAGADASNPEELVKALESVGDMQVDGKAYPGFVADLSSRQPLLQAAVIKAPTCDRIPGV